MINVNTDHILSVKVHYAKPATWFRWREYVPKKKWLFWTIQEEQAEGWYYYDELVTEDYILNESPRKDYVFKDTDGTICDKPYVQIMTLGGKHTQSYYTWFNTDKVAEEYAQEISQKFPHITLL